MAHISRCYAEYYIHIMSYFNIILIIISSAGKRRCGLWRSMSAHKHSALALKTLQETKTKMFYKINYTHSTIAFKTIQHNQWWTTYWLILISTTECDACPVKCVLLYPTLIFNLIPWSYDWFCRRSVNSRPISWNRLYCLESMVLELNEIIIILKCRLFS